MRREKSEIKILEDDIDDDVEATESELKAVAYTFIFFAALLLAVVCGAVAYVL